MAQTIPISQVVTINPGVIGTGGNPLAVNGVFVSSNALVPVGQLLSFPSADDVADYFGVNSDIATLATNYFMSFDNSQKKPQSMLFAPLSTSGRPAWVNGTSLAGQRFADIQNIKGSLVVTVNGTAYSTDSLDFTQATNFSEIATAIQTALDIASVAKVTWNSTLSKFQITTEEANGEQSITPVTGTAAISLGLASGIVSQGANAETPTETMNRAKDLSLNWGTFTVIDETTSTQKEDFAAWTNAQNRRYLYIPWDNDPLAIVANSTTFVTNIVANQYEAVLPVYDNPSVAAMVMGTFASIDWEAAEGRVDPAFKSQSGLEPTVNSLAEATALLGNGYSYYGAYAASGEGNNYNFFYNGALPGSDYGYADTFVNQIFLNSQLQLAIAELLMSVRSLPYNADGYSKIRLACATPISQAINNGTIRLGIALSDLQKAQVISAIGFDVSTELYTQGYYLHIDDASVQTRGQRQSPPATLLYMDGGSIQQITLGSIVIR